MPNPPKENARAGEQRATFNYDSQQQSYQNALPVSSAISESDTLSILAHSRNLLAKTWLADGTIKDYDDARYFQLLPCKVTGIKKLSKLLKKLEKKSRWCMIRGKYIGDEKAKLVDPEYKQGKVRRILDVFSDQPLHTVLIEIDDFVPSVGCPVMQPEDCIREYIEKKLPDCFQLISFHWQLSNSAGHPTKKGLLKAHVWFWLKNPLTSAQLKVWAEVNRIECDKAVFNAVQVHYTSAPVFQDIGDPVPMRSGFVEGALDNKVDLKITDIEKAISQANSMQGSSPISMTDGVVEGSRTIELTRRAGHCFGKGMTYEQAYKVCWEWNQLNKPPLDKKKFEETMKGIHKKELNKNKPGNYRDEIDHLVMARKAIDKMGKENLLSTAAHVWHWLGDGIWKIIVDREIKQHIQRALEISGYVITKGLVDSVADIFKTEIFAKEHKWNFNHNAINFLNGELHWTGIAWELQSHCREHYNTTQIPHNYEANADCPRFRQFLNEIFTGDFDADEKALFIAEAIGYTLVSHAQYETFILLIGSGANGKSVLLDVIRQIVGTDNIAAVQPSQFSNRFQRAHLHLKLANLVTEIAEGAEIADAELKAIVSGELMTAEQKFVPPFNFQPFCTCWFGTNHLPHTRDFSQALFRRAKIIQFNRVYQYGVNADPNLKDKLAAEIPGIVNMALDAFAGVIKRGAFTEPASCLQAKEEWRIEADQVAQYVGDRCELVAEAESISKEVYSDYTSWADGAGIARKVNRKNFTTRLVRLGCKLEKGTAGKRLITGIRVKKEGEEWQNLSKHQ